MAFAFCLDQKLKLCRTVRGGVAHEMFQARGAYEERNLSVNQSADLVNCEQMPDIEHDLSSI